MPAPVTTGKLCTATDQMAIGDIIKCVYEAPTANVAGYFSQLGVLEPKMKVINIKKNGEDDPNPIVEEAFVEYTELPTTPGTTPSGFFYLLKADDGLLIADRMVQSQISWQSINEKNYVYGEVFNAVDAATVKTITTITTERPYQEGDKASSNTTTDNKFNDQTKRSITTTSTVVSIINSTPAEGETAVPEKTKTVKTITEIKYANIDTGE